MIIALLAVLGVDLIVIVILLAALLARRRWVSHQSNAFKAAIRVVDGQVPRLGSKWKHGYGRWVRDVLVWTKAPLLLQNELVAIDGLAGEARLAEPGEVKRVGSDPVIVQLAADGGARIEVAAAADPALGVEWRSQSERADEAGGVSARKGADFRHDPSGHSQNPRQ